MAEVALTDIFGAGATQDITELTLTKANFASVGLTADASNHGEALFVAILKKAAETLTPAAQVANPDQQITIELGTTGTVVRNGTTYRQYPYTILLQKEEPADTVDPDDF